MQTLKSWADLINYDRDIKPHLLEGENMWEGFVRLLKERDDARALVRDARPLIAPNGAGAADWLVRVLPLSWMNKDA